MLGEQGDLAEDILRYLTFRLDFNDYHALSKSQGQGQGQGQSSQ